jgi:ribonuclease HII
LEKKLIIKIETIVNVKNINKINNTRITNMLNICYINNDECVEIGVDEVGRGPMFGRVYTAAVILPKDDSFDHHKMKDSKKFHSKKKIKEVSEYIKKNAIAWSVKWEDEKVIDEINIRNATHSAMHKAIKDIYKEGKDTLLLVDGNDFKPFVIFNNSHQSLEQVPHVTIEGGDNKFTSIAAASILAKVARDEYILELCKENPNLIERYDIENNKGYGTKKHMDGIIKYGITEWHRKSFGICKNFS